MGRHEVAGGGHEEGEGVLGGGDRVGVGGVHDDHPAAGGLVDVDVVDADPGPADDLEPVTGLEHGGGDLGVGADDQGVVVDDGGGQLRFGQAGADVDRDVGGCLEDGETVGAELVGDQHVEHRWEDPLVGWLADRGRRRGRRWRSRARRRPGLRPRRPRRRSGRPAPRR